MVIERLQPNWRTVSYVQIIYIIFNFRRAFIINSRIFMQEYVYTLRFITQMFGLYCFREITWREYVIICLRMREQTGLVLETGIFTGVVPPSVEDNNEKSIGLSSALTSFVVAIYTTLGSNVFFIFEWWGLKLTKKLNVPTEF